jgi:hypothetical protein
MTRLPLFATVIALLIGPVGPGAADPFEMTSDFSVERPRERPTEPTLKGRVEGAAGDFYGGFRGQTVPREDHSAAFDVYLGLRPRFGPLALDLAYSRSMTDDDRPCCGTFALRLNREMGEQAELSAGLQVDPSGETTRAEARANLHFFERTRIDGTLGRNFEASGGQGASEVTLDIGASRPLGTGASLDLRYRDASYRDGRAELSVRVKF